MDPGVRLLELIEARVAKGEDRRSAQARVFAEHRDGLVAAWHLGAGPIRETERMGYQGDALAGGMRRLRQGEQMVEGRTYLHKCSDEASGGGIFAVGH